MSEAWTHSWQFGLGGMGRRRLALGVALALLPAGVAMARPEAAAAAAPATSQKAKAEQQAKAEQKGQAEKEEFTARFVMTQGAGQRSVGMGASGLLYITVEQWSTDAERQALAEALKSDGQKGMLKVMGKMEKGWVRGPNTLRWRLNHAVSMQSDKGRMVRLVTERPLLFAEAAYATVSRDYPFGVIEFLLDEKGKGEGAFIPAASVKINQAGEVEVETFATGPQKLTSVEKD